MRKWAWGLAMLLLAGCNGKQREAEAIVRNELGAPDAIKFRSLVVGRDPDLVCGEVTASDKPLEGWRYFVAYRSLKRAAISPTSSKMTAEAEMGNRLLAGAAEQFYKMCD